jgi:hypothetical protein
VCMTTDVRDSWQSVGARGALLNNELCENHRIMHSSEEIRGTSPQVHQISLSVYRVVFDCLRRRSAL